MKPPRRETIRQVKKMRRAIHRRPEIGYAEHETARRICEWLNEDGIAVRHPVACTGVVGDLDVRQGKPLIAFRADMDALPLEEIDEPARRTYRSRIPGLMHACGHDCHVAIMLGVARELSADRDFRHRAGARFLFQPAEEGGAGAQLMLEEGVLRNPKPALILAGHVSPSLPAGHFGFVSGPAHAATDTLEIRIRGRGGHAARPEECIDPILAAAQLVSGLQAIVARRIAALDATVLSFGAIHGGTRHNIIPDEVVLSGTVRTHEPGVRDQVLKHLAEACTGLDTAQGTTTSLEFLEHYPACIHDDEVTEFLFETARELFGSRRVHRSRPSMGGEDFAYFTAVVPGTMVRIGVNNVRRGITAPCHSRRFDIDERALQESVCLFTEAARRWAKTR